MYVMQEMLSVPNRRQIIHFFHFINKKSHLTSKLLPLLYLVKIHPTEINNRYPEIVKPWLFKANKIKIKIPCRAFQASRCINTSILGDMSTIVCVIQKQTIKIIKRGNQNQKLLKLKKKIKLITDQ